MPAASPRSGPNFGKTSAALFGLSLQAHLSKLRPRGNLVLSASAHLQGDVSAVGHAGGAWAHPC